MDEIRSPSNISKKSANTSTEFLANVISKFKGYITESKKVAPEVSEKIKYNSRNGSGNCLKGESFKSANTDTIYDITTFIRCLFHDFRGPLNNIFLGIDLLSQSIEKNAENTELIKSINESCNFLSDSLDGFLNVQKINNSTEISDLQALKYEPFNIVGLIKNLQYILMLNILDKKIKIVYDIKKVEEWVIGDKKHIQHVLLNLLINAIKYSGKYTKIKIYLDCVNITEVNKTYVIRIEDENDPIPQHIKANLFNKYNTSDTATGTGLGLFICKQIITTHGGTIDHSYSNNMSKGNVFTICLILKVCGASSERDLEMLVSPSTDGEKSEGNNKEIANKEMDTLNYVDISDTEIGTASSAVKLSLPISPTTTSPKLNSEFGMFPVAEGGRKLTNDVGPSPESLVSAEDKSGRNKRLGSGKRGSSMSIFSESCSKSNTKHFMVIDDSETSRKFMLKLLQITCKNIKLYEAVDGLDALVKLVKFGETMQPIDIIFVDNVMPNLTGEFLSKILRCIGYKGLIIGITGNGLEKDVKQFLNNGADYVFIKPFNKNKLNKILDFITTNGYTSKLNVTIVERDGKLMWAT
jgi:CheY-like chemotaxis protein